MMHFVNSSQAYRWWLRLALALALIVGASLRFAGLGFGRGVLCSRPDEELARSAVLITLTGDLNPHYAVWGHLFHYVYSAVAAVWLAAQVWTGRHADWVEAVAAQHVEPWELVWLGRAVSATAGVATLATTYVLGCRVLRSRLGGVAACIVLSSLFLHVRDSHFATCDVLLALNATAALAVMADGRHARPAWAGFWTGLALASKLLAVSVVLTYLTVQFAIALRRPHGATWWALLRSSGVFIGAALGAALVTQPFLLLDPMETCYGMFDDLFNPERQPMRSGFHWANASIVARYYVPQAMGGLVGLLGVCGALLMAARAGSAWWRRHSACPALVPLVFAFWSLVPLVTVDRIFLRYLDGLLPATSVLAAESLMEVGRRFRTGRYRFAAVLALACVAAHPNLIRSIQLDRCLAREDTRAAAGRWIEARVPAGSMVVWAGFGSIAPHLTMPFLHPPFEHDLRHVALRESRQLPTAVDRATMRIKSERNVPAYALAGLALGRDDAPRSSLESYPMLDSRYDVPWLGWWDARVRSTGLLRRESPRWEWMRRHIVETRSQSLDGLVAQPPEYLVLTGLPVDDRTVQALGTQFLEVARFEPGVAWDQPGGRVMYDAGDAWYVPNLGIHRVSRPGPEVRIFRRR